MNIFYLDKSATVAAEYHCNKHVVKMILESIFTSRSKQCTRKHARFVKEALET
jgi:hypothetical protein